MATQPKLPVPDVPDTGDLPVFRDAGAVIYRLVLRQLAGSAVQGSFSSDEQREIASFAADLQQKALLFQDRVSRILASSDDPHAVAALLDDAYAAVTSLAVWAEEGATRLLPAIERLTPAD